MDRDRQATLGDHTGQFSPVHAFPDQCRIDLVADRNGASDYLRELWGHSIPDLA